MDNNHYKVDKLAIVEEKHERASVAVAELEKSCLTPHLAFVKNLGDFKKIRERKTEIDIQLFIWVTMVKIAGFAGIKKEIPELDKGDIIRMLFISFSDLTVEEIYKAFELERYGELGEKTKHYDTFNADYVSDVLRKYKLWRQNVRMANNLPLLNSKVEESVELSEEEKDRITRNGIVSAFNDYRENGELPTPNFWIFDYLYEKGIINKDTPEKQAEFARIWSKAEEEIKAEITAKKSLKREEQRSNRQILEEIANGKSNLVILRSKKIAVRDFFNDLVLNNKNLTTILKL